MNSRTVVYGYLNEAHLQGLNCSYINREFMIGIVKPEKCRHISLSSELGDLRQVNVSFHLFK